MTFFWLSDQHEVARCPSFHKPASCSRGRRCRLTLSFVVVVAVVLVTLDVLALAGIVVVLAPDGTFSFCFSFLSVVDVVVGWL